MLPFWKRTSLKLFRSALWDIGSAVEGEGLGEDWLTSTAVPYLAFPFQSSRRKSSQQMALTAWELAQPELDPKPVSPVLKGRRKAQ